MLKNILSKIGSKDDQTQDKSGEEEVKDDRVAKDGDDDEVDETPASPSLAVDADEPAWARTFKDARPDDGPRDGSHGAVQSYAEEYAEKA